MVPSRNKRTHFRVEQLEGRWTPSGSPVTHAPANGAAVGAFNSSIAPGGTIGAICSVEKGDCAADILNSTPYPSLEITPPGIFG
jgi:hypothetical protein